MPTRYIITAKDATDRANKIRNLGPDNAGIVFQRDTNTLYVFDPDANAVIAIGGVGGNGVIGVAAGYNIARGQVTTATASDTVVTGLATVVSAVANLEDAPLDTVSQAKAVIGDQAGAPAAGSILIQTWKPTTGGAAGNPTLIAATVFSKKVNWIAIGT